MHLTLNKSRCIRGASACHAVEFRMALHIEPRSCGEAMDGPLELSSGRTSERMTVRLECSARRRE
eukprot:11671395-Alexandrium_andersonii.AAC.1